MDGNIRQKDETKRYLPERIPPAATRASEGTLVQAAETVARRCHEAVRPDQAREYTNASTVRERNEGRNKVNNLVRPKEEQALRFARRRWRAFQEQLLRFSRVHAFALLAAERFVRSRTPGMGQPLHAQARHPDLRLDSLPGRNWMDVQFERDEETAPTR